MPELPEVEVLVRHLAPRVERRRIESAEVLRPKSVRPLDRAAFESLVKGSVIQKVTRRAKYLRFAMRRPRGGGGWVLLGHLGMTGRMYLQPAERPREKHTSVVFGLGREEFLFEDARQFGGWVVGEERLAGLGPEPLEAGFTVGVLADALRRSRQAIKVRLLDQSAVAGLGNIYVCEALNVAGIAPTRECASLQSVEMERLHRAIRDVLGGAIQLGLSLPLDPAGEGVRDGLFYFGRAPGGGEAVLERFRVYDREGEACPRCSVPIRRVWMGGRGTFFCPDCQK